MPGFPYKPRFPRRPPDPPDVETPEQSDRRFLFMMLRIAFIAVMAVPLALFLVAEGKLQSLAALALLIEVVLLATVPDLRSMMFRAYLYWNHPLWWAVSERDDSLERKVEREENDPHRGDHLM